MAADRALLQSSAVRTLLELYWPLLLTSEGAAPV